MLVAREQHCTLGQEELCLLPTFQLLNRIIASDLPLQEALLRPRQDFSDAPGLANGLPEVPWTTRAKESHYDATTATSSFSSY